MQATTPRAIKAAFIEAIKAIVPTHADHRDKRFRYVRSVDDVPGPTLRSFNIDIPAPGQPDETYGSGVEHVLELVVYVNYGGLSPDADDSILTEDGAQIWSALESLYEPGLPGLISVQPRPFVQGVSDGDKAGYLWGAFAFQVRYLHSV